MTVYDVEKCFEALWVQECINDMNDAGLKNYKLNILYILNQHAKISVKTLAGMKERKVMSYIIWQGTVWGSLFCTGTLDKLPIMQYENPDILFKYKGTVGVPSLDIVDDIIDIQLFEKYSFKSNAAKNTFIDNKNLTMGKTSTIRYIVEN